MNGDPLQTLKTSLGAFEPNVLLAGIEGCAAIRFAYVLVCKAPSFVPSTWDLEWDPILAVWTVVATAVVLLMGLAVEGLAGAAERLITWTSFASHELRPRYANLFGEPDTTAWRDAQRWIWKSEQASSEFARRRLRLLAARNTAFVLFISTIGIAVGLLVERPTDWVQTFVLAVSGGLAASTAFMWVWIAAQQAYVRAVHDAGKLGPP